jgi:hypothetical protein
MESRNSVRAQKVAARFAGFLFLFTIATAYSVEDHAIGGAFRLGNPAQTAHNIVATASLFRLGIFGELVTAAGVAALIVALYVLLKPVGRGLALLALIWRLIEVVFLSVVAICGLVILRLLSGADYLAPYSASQLQVSTYLLLETHHAGYMSGMFFYTLGSTVFSWLLFKSRYVPRVLSALGILGSLLVMLGAILTVVAPRYAAMLPPVYYIPVVVFEVLVGLWLLILGAKIAEPGTEKVAS